MISSEQKIAERIGLEAARKGASSSTKAGTRQLRQPPNLIDTAIIGAGPYGLSLAAHLAACKVRFRIFGHPMRTWSAHMPEGMMLKSEGFASNLSDPTGALTLERYCRDRGLPYEHIGLPVSLATFVSYGLAFQERFVPGLEQRDVICLTRSRSGFLLRLDDGEELHCQRVVVAVGVTHFAFMPEPLIPLPKVLVSHSSAHRSLARFRDQEIAVIGAGASAVDIAVLAQEAGAKVHLVARRAAIDFNGRPDAGPRPLRERLRSPQTGLGAGWRSWFCTQMPLLFHQMPEQTRRRIVHTHLGPAAGWFMRDAFADRVIFHPGMQISGAVPSSDGVTLALVDTNGIGQELAVDHVITATGYRPDTARLQFLDRSLAAPISTSAGTPVLSRQFESRVSGLFFVGLAAADSFGPMLRFAYGAAFTAKRLSRHLARTDAVSVP